MSTLKINNNIININQPILTVKELLNKLNYKYNDIFLDRFWQNIKDDIWIYIDDNMLKYIGYNCTDSRDDKKKYLNILKDNFEETIDYKLLNSCEFKKIYEDFKVLIENNTFNEHNKVKHLIVSPDCFKQSLMLLKTKKSKEIKKYYIELEKVFKFYLEYQNEYRRLELENNQKELENKNQELKEKENIINKINVENYLKSNFYFQNIKLNREEYIYIASTNKYLHSNIYKVGKTTNFHSRIHTYQTGRFGDDKYYYLYIFKCHNASILEQYILNKLKIFRYVDKNSKTYKELFQLDYSILLNLIKNIEQFENNNISYLNNAFEVYINNSNKENLNKPEIIENITEYLNKKELEYCNKNINEIPDLIDNDDIKNNYNIYANEDNKSNLTKEIIENKLNNTVKLISEYTGNCDDELEFECNSIFKHRFKITYSHLLRKKDRGCYYCTKHGILDKIQIYEYDNKYNYIKSYNGFDELKNLNSNYQLLKNIIREKRWLTPNDNRIYSILEPDNNLLNIKKELNKYEKLILNTLNIKIEDIINKYKKLDSDIKYIYAIDNYNNIIYKSTNYTIFSKKINYMNSNKKINRKTIPNYININKEYGGYIWLDNLNNIEINNYNTIEI